MTMHGHTDIMQILTFKLLYMHWISKAKPC